MPGYLFAVMCFGSTFLPSTQISRKPTLGSEDHFACMTTSCQWPRCSGARSKFSRQALVAWSTRHILMLVSLAPKRSEAEPVSPPPLASWCHSTTQPAGERDDGVPSSSHFGYEPT